MHRMRATTNGRLQSRTSTNCQSCIQRRAAEESPKNELSRTVWSTVMYTRTCLLVHGYGTYALTSEDVPCEEEGREDPIMRVPVSPIAVSPEPVAGCRELLVWRGLSALSWPAQSSSKSAFAQSARHLNIDMPNRESPQRLQAREVPVKLIQPQCF